MPRDWSGSLFWLGWALLSQNGSLVCHIIRNTWGYRLILLWCHHLRKSARMCLAQLWLAPLCLWGSRHCSIFLLIVKDRVTDDPGFMLDKLPLCFQDITKSILEWDIHTWCIHIRFARAGFSFPVTSTESTMGISHLCHLVDWALFRR